MPETAATIPAILAQLTERLGDDGAEQLGALYEGLRDLGERRASGAFYTPLALAEPLVRCALEPLAYDGPRQGAPRRRWRLRAAEELLSLRVCDPAVGGGAFLVRACHYLAERLLEARGERSPADAVRARALVARHCLFGMDCDPVAVEITRHSLRLLAGEPVPSIDDAIRCGDALAVAWPEGGFDAVLCNPPFGNAIRDLSPTTKAGLRGRFAGLSGTADLAYYFLALGQRLTNAEGVTAFVLPRAFLTAPAARSLRRSLLRERPPSLIWCPDGGRHFAGADVRVVALVLGGRGGCRGGARWPLAEVVVEGENWWAPLAGAGQEEVNPRATSTRIITYRGGHARVHVARGFASSAPLQGLTLADRFEVMASMTTAMAYDLLPHLRDDDRGDGLRLVTAGLIDPGACSWGRKGCRYLGRTLTHPRITTSGDLPPALRKRLQLVRRPKLLVAAAAGPGDRVEAFFDRAGSHCGAVSTLTVLDPADDASRLEALCDFLNGDEVARRLRQELGASAMGSGLLTVSKAFLGRLPAD